MKQGNLLIRSLSVGRICGSLFMYVGLICGSVFIWDVNGTSPLAEAPRATLSLAAREYKTLDPKNRCKIIRLFRKRAP